MKNKLFVYQILYLKIYCIKYQVFKQLIKIFYMITNSNIKEVNYKNKSFLYLFIKNNLKKHLLKFIHTYKKNNIKIYF